MAINLGSNPIKDVKLGSLQVEKLYLGDELVFGGEDDGNLLTSPYNYSYGGVEWTWNKFDATGYGGYSVSGGAMCPVTPLKETLTSGEKCIFSIKEPYTYNLRITLSGNVTFRIVLNAGQTSVQANITGNVDSFQIFNLARKGTAIDETIKGFKLVKAE